MIELIPAIDIIGGKCVRLSQGDYNRSTEYSSDPLSIAQMFESAGVRRLHLVDLDGAKSSHVVNIEVLRLLSSQTGLTIDFGGGIKSESDLESVFSNGASMVTIGSLAVKSPSTLSSWIRTYGAERFIIGADLKNGKLSINGWQEETDSDLTSFLDYYTDLGISKVLCTDISRDGMLCGPSIELYRSILENYPEMELIASGGVSSIDDINELELSGVCSVVFGKAFYEGRISLDDIKSYKSLRELC